jgi:hypothetical protein
LLFFFFVLFFYFVRQKNIQVESALSRGVCLLPFTQRRDTNTSKILSRAGAVKRKEKSNMKKQDSLVVPKVDFAFSSDDEEENAVNSTIMDDEITVGKAFFFLLFFFSPFFFFSPRSSCCDGLVGGSPKSRWGGAEF